MSLRFLASVFVCLLLVTRAGASGNDAKKPTLLSRTLQAMHLGPHPASSDVHSSNLTLSMDLAPQPLKLSEARQLKVTLELANHSKKHVHLEFPTTQRIEVIVRNQAAKTIAQWSEDQSFTAEPGYVTVNPGEHIEYSALISTRDMAAGQTYIVEGFFPNFTQLKIQKSIAPQK